MSTLSGIASKGEKGKSKYQCLDINNLYRGESLEPSQQKSTVQRCKYGMQSLGKVPSARRPPANLPSLKSENSGSEPAVSLVPTGGVGWGNKPGENQSPTPTQPNVTTSSNSTQSNTTSQVQAAPPSAVLSTQSATLTPGHEQTAAPTTHTTAGDKSWSSIMAGEAGGHPPSFLAHQSPLFQQEFPKLTSGDPQNAPAGPKGGTDTQYGPGPSLRPQTEGSWIQGGGRPQTGAVAGASGSQAASLVQGPLPHHPSGVEAAGGRNSLGPHPPPGVAMGPGGPGLGIPTNGPPIHGPPMHMPPGTSPQFRTMGTPFIYRGSFPAPPGPFPPNFQAGIGPPRQRFPGNYLSEGRYVGRPVDGEEIVTRPIIKEEELNHMDDIARDSSWARPDEIDYNEKIVFSDTEDSVQDDEGQARRDEKIERDIKECRESSDNDKERNRDDKDRARDWDRERDRDRRADERADKRGTDAGSRNRATPTYTRPSYPSSLRPQTSSAQRDRENEEEIWKEKRRFQIEMVARVTERAKQRKEEEEKRHEETKRRLGKTQSNEVKEREDNSTTVVPLPNWADKNRQAESDRERSRTSSEGVDEKLRHDVSEMRQSSQQSAVVNLRSERDNRSRPSIGSDDRVKRDFDEKETGKMASSQRQDKGRSDARERSTRSSGEGPQSYLRHFQNNLPPRFLKQHAERNQSAVSSNTNYLRSTGSPQPSNVAAGFESHWSHSSGSFIGQSSAPPNSGSRMPPRRFNSESSESNTEKSRNDRDAEEWDYERYKSARERSYGKHGASYYEDHSRRYTDRSERREIDSDRNSEDNWERERDRDRDRDRERERERDKERERERERERDKERERERERERDKERERDPGAREKERERHADERHKSESNYEEEREWRKLKERKSEEKEPSELEENREKEVCKKEERKEERRLERPQRPDSRDSRASRESRNSRDSARDEKHDIEHKTTNLNRGFSSTFNDFKEEKKKANEKDKKDNHGKYADEYPLSFPNKSRHRFNYQRHMPGPPITREKLEASEKNEGKRNLTQLKRFSDSKRAGEEKEGWEGHVNKERNSNELWTETALDHKSQNAEVLKPSTEVKNKTLVVEKRETAKAGNELTNPDTQEKVGKSEINEERNIKIDKRDEEREKREKSSKNRGGRGRSETGRGRQGLSVPVYRSSHGSRGDRRRRDSGRVIGPRNRFCNREWNPVSESDGSGDEVSASTESGKEEKKLDGGRGAKPRSHFRKSEKEERNKETKKSESGESKSSLQSSSGPRFDRKGEFLGSSNREGFAPSGQPSRRGRGSVRMRGGISHRMDGYGPPPAKSPFSHHEDKKVGSEKSKDTLPEEKPTGEDDNAKLKQQSGSGSTSIINCRGITSGSKINQVPPRLQKKSDTEPRESNRKLNRGSRHHPSKLTPDQGDDAWETTSENSEEERKQEIRGGRKNYQRRGPYYRGEGPGGAGGGSRTGRGASRSSFSSDKKFGSRESHGIKSAGPGSIIDRNSKSASSSVIKGEGSAYKDESKLNEGNLTSQNVSSEISKGKEEKGIDLNRPLGHIRTGGVAGVKKSIRCGYSIETPRDFDCDDFDEGRTKKKENKDGLKSERRSGRDRDKERRIKSSKDSGSHQQQQQAANAMTASAPQPLMSQVVPVSLSMGKNYERLTNLPPRLAKQRQNHRIQKQQTNETSDGSKINHSMNMFSMKESGVGSQSVNAWEKPLRSASPIKSASMQMTANSSEPLQSDNSSPRSSPHVPREPVDKSLLDGSSPPVNTIIFENTNFKSTPNDIVMKNQFNNHVKQQRLEKGERKIKEEPEDMLGFSTGKNDVTSSNSTRDIKTSESPIIYGKSEDNADMKLDFQFETELSQLTDDKSTKGMRDLARSIQQSNMSPSTADLNFKIASVKKVWETMHTVTEHSEDGNVSTFSPNFSPESTMDPSTYGKTVDGSVVVDADVSEVVYNAVPHMGQVNVSYTASKTDVSSTTSNVCKVKPQQQTVLSSGHSPIGHSGQSPLSHGGPISPPPYSTAQGGQFNYQQQTGIGGTAAQFGGMSAIPSPPTVLYNSSTQLPPGYQTFQIDGTQVLSSQAARSQFSQFAPYGLSQGLGQTSAFSQQSVYLHQTAPPTPAPDLYQSSLPQYRLQPAAGPFGQSQLNNNPNTVLISSTANSLMSATVKPSTQPIGAIGTKGATPFQQNALPSQHSQLYIPFDPVQLGVNQSYLPNSQLVQRGGPVQASASSFYSSSAGAQAGFYQTPGSTLTQQGPGASQLHQAAGYSLQGFNSQSSAPPVGLPSFGSQMGAQQYRTPGSVAPTTYLKSAVTHHHPTALNLAQKSSTTSSQQDVLDSVFSSAPQIPSPKPRPSKQISQQQQQSQQSPTQQSNNKFGSYQSVTQSSSQLQATGPQRVSQSNVNIQNVKSSGNSPRYPNPIQRPVSYQHSSSRYRPQQPRPASSVKPYFGSQDGNLKLEESGDLKPEDAAQLNCDSKISDTTAQAKTDGSEDDTPKE